jgi:hypothetical protein
VLDDQANHADIITARDLKSDFPVAYVASHSSVQPRARFGPYPTALAFVGKRQHLPNVDCQ